MPHPCDALCKKVYRWHVDPILQFMEAEGGSQQLFDPEYVEEHNAVVIGREGDMHANFNAQSTILIFSTSFGKKHVYHFPLFQKWSDMLTKNVLEPLKIPLEKVVHMQLAHTTNNCDMKFQSDKGTWVQQTH